MWQWNGVNGGKCSKEGKGGKGHNGEWLASWHRPLYFTMAAQIHEHLKWAKANTIKDKPYVLVLGYLHRTVGPFKAFMSSIFSSDEVNVAIPDGLDVTTVTSSHGRTPSILHLFKHRRTINAQNFDQHRGI